MQAMKEEINKMVQEEINQYFRAKEYKFDPSGLVTINTQQEIVANGETVDVDDYLPKNYPQAFGQMIIEPNDDIRNQGLRLMKNKANWDNFVLTGCNNDTQDRDGLVAPLPTPPIEYATQQVVGIGVFDFFTWGKATLLNNRPKFSGSSYNISLNAIMYITKQATTQVVWLNPIPIDCLINPDVCDSYALYNQ
ncbi:MAG: hypothetical protein EZS28_034927 [Streblomastix strix]|uniref:Uncharacterized protein n=1 Tax=Streblomastix strix TaxID=222440 RepID=A0A5J4UFK0_9EUKA|nr:MAG: hypothetical protein EZS28_034927 [Streblomastix strix]